MTWLVGKKPIRSVLLTRLRYLGDVAMSTVLCEALKAGDPQLRLGYLAEQAHGIVLADHPHLAQVHLLGVARRGADSAARGHEQSSGVATQAQAVGTMAMIAQLRRAKYDLAVDLFFNPRSAWLLRLSGIPLRIGGTRKWRQRLYTHTVLRADVGASAPDFAAVAPGGLGEHLCRLAPLTHAESGLDFLAWLGENFAPGDLKPRLGAAAAPHSADPFWVLAPCATWPAKEWPAEHWQQLVQELSAGNGPKLKILLPPGRESAWNHLVKGCHPERVEVLPSMELPAVKNLLAQASGLISVDGGVMHMGVALGIATLGLFGPTDPSIWFPYEKMGPYRVLLHKPHCHPCDLHECGNFICLPELSVAQVATAARELFGSQPRSEAGVTP